MEKSGSRRHQRLQKESATYALAVFYGIMRLNVRLTRGPTGEAVFGT
jgi:hypothetical protein